MIYLNGKYIKICFILFSFILYSEGTQFSLHYLIRVSKFVFVSQ